MKRLDAQLRTAPGHTLTAGELAVTPVAQTLSIRLPFGGFVWNRPVAVEVRRGEIAQRIPILDVTRIVQVGALASILVLTAFAVVKFTGRME